MTGVDAPQHRGGLVIAQSASEHLVNIVGGAQSQAGLAFDGGDEIIQHRIDRLLGQLGHLNHGHAQRMYLFGVEKTDDACGLFFA